MGKVARVSMRGIMAQMTIKINLMCIKEFRIRVWMGLKLVWLASKVMGMGFKVEKHKEISLPMSDALRKLKI